MSSHHFVKEGQEPALFILDSISLAHIESLLEWAPMIMVVDSMLDTVLSWGIKIDAVLAREDRVESITENVREQMPVEIFTYEHKENPLTAGLKKLITQQHAVHVIAEINDKVFEIGQSFATDMDIVFMNNELRWTYINTGNFKKWVPAKTKLFVKGNSMHDLSFELLQPIHENIMESTLDGLVSIESKAPFWIGEFFN